MKLGKLPILGFILAIFLGQLLLVGTQMDFRSTNSLYDESGEGLPEIQNAINPDSTNMINTHYLAADQIDGIIDPIQIKQTGYQTIDAKRGNTNSGTNTISTISIDEANGWFVNSTDIEVWNLKRLYGINGTFDDGVDPWTNYTIDGGSNTQLVSYNSTGGYVVCRN
ncbi:MAG: hypothetical protein ACTSQZ_08260, partial [Candidatus Thorarchaeota archaeon]